MTKKWIAASVACLIILSIMAVPISAAEDWSTQSRVVKVGYFEFPGYQERGENDAKSGYGYAYLQELKKYANWQYEYVYAPYDECLEMLKKGEIDLLTSVSYSESRDAYLDYADTPMGTKDTILTVKSSNTTYMAGEYLSFNGMHVGMLSDNTSNAKFDAFSQEHHFSYTVDDHFTTIEELTQALQEGKVDAIVTSNLRRISNERLIAEFNLSPYYATVKAGNETLLNELNVAMEKINIVTPMYESTLYQKYYGADQKEGVAFSADEQAYIRDNPEVSILIAPSLEPMVYSENGEVKGIIAEIIKKAMEPSGLKVNFTEATSDEEYQEKKGDAKTYPVLGMVDENIYAAESGGLRLTSPYLTMSYNVITKVRAKQDKVLVAAVKNEDVTRNYIEKHYKPEEIKYYKNKEECVKAVSDGDVTLTIVNSYNGDRIIENDVSDVLISNTVAAFNTKITMSVHNDADYRLFSILNKSINALSEDDVRIILIDNTLYKDKSFSLIEVIYRYPAQIIFGVMLFFTLVILLIIFVLRQKQLEKEQASLKEAANFAKIASEANGKITELNLNTKSVLTYAVTNGQLTKHKSLLSIENLDEKMRFERIYKEDLPKYLAIFSKENMIALAGTEKQETYSLKVKAEKGDYRWNLFTLQGVLPDDAHPNNLMVFQKDIDTLKREEELRKQQLTDALNTAIAASEAKGTFMSRMSHEIRTPLNAVIGYMTIAKSNAQSVRKMNDCITKAEIAAKHLLLIINDVLDMSSIESGKLKIAHTGFDFRELISEIATVFYSQTQSKDIQFEVMTNGVSEDFLIGDKLRVNQILMNLLSNAVKFTPSEGTIYFTVVQKAIKNNIVFIQFIISDSGIGMDEQFKKRLFMPFEQQDAITSQQFGGTGLGLSITKNLVTMMKGNIDVKSSLNKGTTFTVELPFECDHSQPTTHVTVRDFSHVHALILDDEPGACEYMQILMQRCGVQSETALTGKIAVEMVEKAYKTESPFDLCLMDWKMPDMDGVETVKRIRACVGKEMPIIIVTAYDFSEIEEDAKEAGVNLFVSKPLFQSTVVDLLMNSYGKFKNIPIEKDEKMDHFQGKRLLLVEDNEMNREIAVDILTQYGFEIDCAENGQEAVTRFEASETGTYAAVLMDIQMPVMNGYEATKAMRSSSHPEAKTIPIIAMTANAFSEDIAASLSAGMDDHISKPVDLDQLCTILKRVIQ
ncbi:MAG: response regulator [Eubacterium sp.]